MSHRPILPRLRALIAVALAALSPLLASAQAGSTPLLYEVRSPSNTVFLFGTIHVGARALYPLSQQVEDCFARAGVLALEADPTEAAGAAAAMAMGMYQPPDTLGDHISAELYGEVQAVLPQVGLPIEFARAMKPYLLAMTIAMLEIQRLGYDAALGLDAHFARRARAQRKPIVQLESMEQQMALFENLPPGTQEGLLRMAVRGVASGELGVEVSELMDAWKAGNVSGIQRSVARELEDLPPEAAETLRERLYDRRNRHMAAKVIEMLAGSEPHFVAVGAGHLIGPTGLPELLRQRGYEVRRL